MPLYNASVPPHQKAKLVQDIAAFFSRLWWAPPTEIHILLASNNMFLLTTH